MERVGWQRVRVHRFLIIVARRMADELTAAGPRMLAYACAWRS